MAMWVAGLVESNAEPVRQVDVLSPIKFHPEAELLIYSCRIPD